METKTIYLPTPISSYKPEKTGDYFVLMTNGASAKSFYDKAGDSFTHINITHWLKPVELSAELFSLLPK